VWGFQFVMAFLIGAASSGSFWYYPDETGAREKIPYVPLSVCSVVVFCSVLSVLATVGIHG